MLEKLLTVTDYARKHQGTDALFLSMFTKSFQIFKPFVSVVPLTINLLPFDDHMNTVSEVQSPFDYWVDRKNACLPSFS